MNFKKHREISRQTWHTNDTSWEQRLQHACLGLIDETGELSSCLKKQIGYNQKIDLVNMKEELGDKIYFLHRLLDESEFTEKGKNPHISLDYLLREINPFVRTPFESICQLSYDMSVLVVQVSYRLRDSDLPKPEILVENSDVIRVLTSIIQLIGHYEFTLSDVLESNINKLKARYGKKMKFSEEKAINRDIAKERKSLS
jgi:hypothetical protein